MRRTLIAAAAACALSCSGSDEKASKSGGSGGAPGDGGFAGVRGDGGYTLPPLTPQYDDIGALHEVAFAPTCSLNNGVCHNSKEYPDLRTVTKLVDAIGLPCNVGVTGRDLVFDVCEQPGDRLVVPSASVDVEIAAVEVGPDSAEIEDLEWAKIRVNGTVDPSLVGATDIEVHRGETRFLLHAENNVSVASVTADVVELALAGGYIMNSAQAFLDTREWPLGPNRVREADLNGNGTSGTARLRLIEPGDPMKSFMLLRLIEEQYGTLMPRQCRTWDDYATRSFACWIEGLEVDAEGRPTNALEPIDHEACSVDVVGLGRCEPIVGTGWATVEAIFASACGGSDCHVGEAKPAGMLDLSSGKAYDALVDVPTDQLEFRTRVVPGDPDASYLMCKLDADCADRQGSRMPAESPPLPDEALDIIRDWIADGATRE